MKLINTLFINYEDNDHMISQIHVDDNVTNEFMCETFATLMKREFEISMMDELSDGLKTP